MSRRTVDFVERSEELQRKIKLDQKLVALKQLRDLQVDPIRRMEIQDWIDKRIAELANSSS